MSPFSPYWRSERLLAAAALCLLLSSCAPGGQGQPPGETDMLGAELASARRRTAVLEDEVELARRNDFYLVLDPAVPELILELRGAELRRYRVVKVELGRGRTAWVPRGDAKPPIAGVVRSGGEIVPPRRPRAAHSAIPPTPEEAWPVPPRYEIRFDDGLSIDIRREDAEGSPWARFRSWCGSRWNEAVAAAFRPGPRLRLVMDTDDARSLYRALPPAVKLLVRVPIREASAASP